MHCQLLLLLAVYSNSIEAGPVRHRRAFISRDILPRFNNQSAEHLSTPVETTNQISTTSSSPKPTLSSTSILQFTALGGSFVAGRPSDVLESRPSGNAQPLGDGISQTQVASSEGAVQPSGFSSTISSAASVSSSVQPVLGSATPSSVSSTKISGQATQIDTSTNPTSPLLSTTSSMTSRSAETSTVLSAAVSKVSVTSQTSKTFRAATSSSPTTSMTTYILGAVTSSSSKAATTSSHSGAVTSSSLMVSTSSALLRAVPSSSSKAPTTSGHFGALTSSSSMASTTSLYSGAITSSSSTAPTTANSLGPVTNNSPIAAGAVNSEKNKASIATSPASSSSFLPDSAAISPSPSVVSDNLKTTSAVNDQGAATSQLQRSSTLINNKAPKSTLTSSKTLTSTDRSTISPLGNNLPYASSSTDLSVNPFSTSNAQSSSALSPQIFKAAASNYPDAHGGNIAMANGYNQIFKSLTQEASCDPADNKQYVACISGQPAKCEAGGNYTLYSCPQGQSCYAVPMPSGQSGVNIGCVKPSDAANAMRGDVVASSSVDSISFPQPTQSSSEGTLGDNQRSSDGLAASGTGSTPVATTQATIPSVSEISTNTPDAQDNFNQSAISSSAVSATGDPNLVVSFPDNLPPSATTAATPQTSAAEDGQSNPTANQKDSIPPANNPIPQVSAAPTSETSQQVAADREPASTTIAATSASSADAAGITIVPEGATTGANGFVTVTVTVTTTVHDSSP